MWVMWVGVICPNPNIFYFIALYYVMQYGGKILFNNMNVRLSLAHDGGKNRFAHCCVYLLLYCKNSYTMSSFVCDGLS